MGETALVVVVDEARPVVDPWRRRFARQAMERGLAPHITLLYPFVPDASVDAELLVSLQTLDAGLSPFAFEGSQAEVAAVVRAGISQRLPLSCRADAVTLLQEGRDGGRQERAWLRLGGP